MFDSSYGCDPAATVIKYLGGYHHVANIVDKKYQTIWRTTRPRNSGGGGGVLSGDIQLRLLDFAREHRVSLTASDFYNPTRLKQIMMAPIHPQHCIICGVGCSKPVPYSKAWWMAGRAARKRFQFYDPHLEARIVEEEMQMRAQLENLKIQKDHLQELKRQEEAMFEAGD